MAIAGLLAIAVPAVAAQPESVSADQLRGLAPVEVARRVLGLFGDKIVEVEPTVDEQLVDLTMATRPYGASSPGLCAADLVRVYFKPTLEKIPTVHPEGAKTLTQPANLEVETRYQISGQMEWPAAGRTEAADAELDARCAQLKRAWTFYSAPDAPSAWLAARAVELAHPFVAARDRDVGDYVTLDHLSEVARSACVAGEKEGVRRTEGLHCLSLTFRRNMPFNVVDAKGKVLREDRLDQVVTLDVRLRVHDGGKHADRVVLVGETWTQPEFDGVP